MTRWMFATTAVLAVMLGCQQSDRAREFELAAAARSNAPGRPAPAFTLPDQDQQMVSLSDYRGQWLVLYFYPEDDTPACACQATEFTQLLTEFHGMNAAVVGINDDGPGMHQQFIEKYDLRLRLLSDRDHSVMEAYGVWDDSPMAGGVQRQTFIIGPDGMIRFHYPEVDAQGHAERVRQKLAELQGQGM